MRLGLLNLKFVSGSVFLNSRKILFSVAIVISTISFLDFQALACVSLGRSILSRGTSFQNIKVEADAHSINIDVVTLNWKRYSAEEKKAGKKDQWCVFLHGKETCEQSVQISITDDSVGQVRGLITFDSDHAKVFFSQVKAPYMGDYIVDNSAPRLEFQEASDEDLTKPGARMRIIARAWNPKTRSYMSPGATLEADANLKTIGGTPKNKVRDSSIDLMDGQYIEDAGCASGPGVVQLSINL